MSVIGIGKALSALKVLKTARLFLVRVMLSWPGISKLIIINAQYVLDKAPNSVQLCGPFVTLFVK